MDLQVCGSGRNLIVIKSLLFVFIFKWWTPDLCWIYCNISLCQVCLVGYTIMNTLLVKAAPHHFTEVWMKLPSQWYIPPGMPLCSWCMFPWKQHDVGISLKSAVVMMTSSNGNIFRVTGHLCGKFTGPRWIPRTKASDAELWCFLWFTPE